MKCNNQSSSINVKIRYIASSRQFVDPHTHTDESLSSLKSRALEFFNLSEGNVDGGTKTYYFALNGVVLTDLGATLSSLADCKLKFDLIERFEQG